MDLIWGAIAYEIGNPYLELEKTLGFESSLQYAKIDFLFFEWIL